MNGWMGKGIEAPGKRSCVVRGNGTRRHFMNECVGMGAEQREMLEKIKFEKSFDMSKTDER